MQVIIIRLRISLSHQRFIIKFALLSNFIGPGGNNFVRSPPAASIYLRDAHGGASEWRNVLYARWREVSFRIRPSRRCTLIVPGTNNELPAPLSSRRRKTLRNETARWEYEIVACVSARVFPHMYTERIYTHTHIHTHGRTHTV